MKALRHALLDLHRAIIEAERVAIEREAGRLTATEMWKLLVSDPRLAWLGPLSALIVRFDEALDGGDVDEASLRAAVSELLVADPAGSGFQQKYAALLQDHPAIVLAHGAVMKTR